MKALLIPNLDKKNGEWCTNEACRELNKVGITPCLDIVNQSSFTDVAAFFGDFNELMRDCDFVITIGGDGTLIHAAKKAAFFEKPIVGVNVGRLGFMSLLEPTGLSVFSKFIDGTYLTEKRMMLEITKLSHDKEEKYYALNDAVISKGATSKIVDLNLCCNGKFVSSYRADGIILSTPTGSTAYNMSAGGPVISPTIESIAMTPICPHSLVSRTIIFASADIITVSGCYENNDFEIFLTIDGEPAIRIDRGDTVIVQKASIDVKLLNFEHKDFFEVLNEKIMLRG